MRSLWYDRFGRELKVGDTVVYAPTCATKSQGHAAQNPLLIGVIEYIPNREETAAIASVEAVMDGKIQEIKFKVRTIGKQTGVMVTARPGRFLVVNPADKVEDNA